MNRPMKHQLYGGREHTTTNFPFSFLRWIKSLRNQLYEKSATFDKFRGSTNRRDKVWKDANSFFLRRFHYLRRIRRCLSSLLSFRDHLIHPGYLQGAWYTKHVVHVHVVGVPVVPFINCRCHFWDACTIFESVSYKKKEAYNRTWAFRMLIIFA